MSSIVRTNMKRFFGRPEKLHFGSRNNRKRTRRRHIQIDPATKKVIRHDG